MGFKEIGRKIQQAREEKGLTQVELSLALGITQAALSNYELGKRRLYHHQIENIAKILGKDLEYFIGSGAAAFQGAPHGASSLHDQILSRIKIMSPKELRDLCEYLDFIAWRKTHG